MTEIGARVLIVEDCREGGPATGQTGVYEGDHPYSVILGYQHDGMDEPEFKPGEYAYEAYQDGSLKLTTGDPVNLYYREWMRGEQQQRPLFAMPIDNPRIRLDDGTVIWGAQCWWREVEDGISLEEAKLEF